MNILDRNQLVWFSAIDKALRAIDRAAPAGLRIAQAIAGAAAVVEAIAQRGVPFSECTPEEIGALDRCLAEFEAAERMFAGAMLFDRQSRPNTYR